MTETFRKEALFEMRFWMQVLGDHGRFIHDSLSPSEKVYVERAQSFINKFDKLLDNVRHPLTNVQLSSVLNESLNYSKEIRSLKLDIIKDHLVGDVKIQLPPSFLNHMVNEVDEAIRVLTSLVNGELPPKVHPLHHDLIWLLDAAGHAGAITDNLDHVEYDLRYKSEQFKKDWEDFYFKAVELTGYLRANVKHFPALEKFHKDIELEMVVFKTFLNELEEMRLNKESLGVLSPLMADHMAREECYYLMKLAETTELELPECDPTTPRTE
ncbi:DUF2935 domain-containing protein [Bacillus alkalicola]|uniref:DUF2935 domain-containing protein n=1 Tax=Evansella alkalicola TaxID=745819 RepID=A0ABS6JQG4_9BACI|nr:DUF2935 domain-containing protein [Bacillus alkalicola]MBU9719954.1 DUF2935 domain-containing protein [Bacillus alkalicola]